MRSGVVAPDGLVGQVTTVDPRSSLAILWTHPDFRASAMSADGSAFGIVRPHLGEESGRSLLELRGVRARRAELARGRRTATVEKAKCGSIGSSHSMSFGRFVQVSK